MGRHATAREKTVRAWQAYLDLLDTAGWMEEWMGRHLENFGLTMSEFRLLELLHREGPKRMAEAGECGGKDRMFAVEH